MVGIGWLRGEGGGASRLIRLKGVGGWHRGKGGEGGGGREGGGVFVRKLCLLVKKLLWKLLFM